MSLGRVAAFCILALLGIFVRAVPAVAATCSEDAVDIRFGGSSVRFSVEIADDDAERSRGLMFRESMPRFHGMLFVYAEPQPVAFWMKNTPLPLDMLFFDERGVLQRIAHRAVPQSTETIPGGSGILEVLEINGGLAEALGIGEGAEMRHPSLDPEFSAWPCPVE